MTSRVQRDQCDCKIFVGGISVKLTEGKKTFLTYKKRSCLTTSNSTPKLNLLLLLRVKKQNNHLVLRLWSFSHRNRSKGCSSLNTSSKEER